MRRVGRRGLAAPGVVLALAIGLTVATVAPVAAWSAAPTPGAKAPTDGVRSIVVLGDSVAAGEGARDGYVYQDRAVLPAWGSPRPRPRAEGPCGRTSAAYGARVARTLDAELTNLACSGASFEQGIALDGRYDAARPDLVLVTAGANSVAFERAYAFCVLSSRGVAEGEADRIVRSANLDEALATAVGLGARRLLGSTPTGGDAACTAARPGAYLQETVLDRADAIGVQARALADAIRARGADLGRVPEIVFTTYPDPLPDAAVSVARCPDGAGLGAAQLALMHDLFGTLNDELRGALVDVPGVRIADPDPAFAGHRWCDHDPWVLGPSILLTEPRSRAPFHPTSAGQRAIAETVLAARNAVPGAWRGTV